MKAVEIRGLSVHPEGETTLTGTVSDLVLDAEARHVRALVVQVPDGDLAYLLQVADIVRIDEESVAVTPDAALLPQADAARFDGLPTLARMLEEKVITESGHILGKLTDIDINPSSWTVTEYGVVGNLADALERGSRAIPPAEVLNAGAHMLLVKDSAPEERSAAEQ
jgi:sporulation protein YlmC with PRC-barrel domain